MPLLNGLQTSLQILTAFPATKALMLSAHSDDVYVGEAINSSADGLEAPIVPLWRHFLRNKTCAGSSQVMTI